MADPIFISDLINKITAGQIRIPSFQRGFVWDADRVAHLMDSIYKGYPFGALLFWRTKIPLNSERKLGPFELPKKDPDFPTDYVLDGQQRATSIFGVFQSDLQPAVGEDDSAFKIYFDLTAAPNVQDSSFLFVADSEVDPDKHFPLRLLFNPPEYRKYLKKVDEPTAEKVDELYTKFTQARIPVQTFETNEREAVAIVFERINRMGVELDTLQLLSAWTWSDDFDLQDEFEDLAEALEPFGFKGVGEDSDLLLRCCAAIVRGDASPSAIINLKGVQVRERFQEIRKGVLGAIDFLRSNCKVHSASYLPSANILVPLSVFFATDKEQDTVPSEMQQQIILRWFWRTVFSRRYSKRLEQLNEDIQQILKLRNGDVSTLGQFSVELQPQFFIESTFNFNTVNTKAFVLLLAMQGPLNFISGAPVQLQNALRESNRKEFHHLFPRKFLQGIGTPVTVINALANFAVLGRAENNKLGGSAPSGYRKKMTDDNDKLVKILEHSFCDVSIFEDDFKKFINERAQRLVEAAYKLMEIEYKPKIAVG